MSNFLDLQEEIIRELEGDNGSSDISYNTYSKYVDYIHRLETGLVLADLTLKVQNAKNEFNYVKMLMNKKLNALEYPSLASLSRKVATCTQELETYIKENKLLESVEVES